MTAPWHRHDHATASNEAVAAVADFGAHAQGTAVLGVRLQEHGQNSTQDIDTWLSLEGTQVKFLSD
jgi:hypothetical protein